MTKPIVRLVMAVSLDGKIAINKDEKQHIGGKGDKKVLEKSLAWSDCTLIGGQTLRTHKSTCLIKDPLLIKERINSGRSEQPIATIVSNKKNYSSDWLFFNQPIERWLLSTTEKATNSTYYRGYHRQIFLHNKWSTTLSDFYDLGVRKLTVLGGARLATSLLSQNAIDEIQLTITPKIIGGEINWISSNLSEINLESLQKNLWELNSASKLENNELMISYSRTDQSKEQ